VKPANEKILAQQATLKEAFNDINSSTSSQSNSTKTSQAEDVNMTSTENKPTVPDIPETPSITITPPHQAQPPSSQPPLTVSDLIDHYLAPESLSGENQYQCDHCNMLRDAVKTTSLRAAPEYLNITLLRFKYDRTSHRRAKVFTTIEYPDSLCLPVTGGGHVTYRLYGVVVHSGYSSDGGHYYTWARPGSQGPATWLLLNDSQVTESSWAQFKQQSSKLSRDTPYLLFYQRVGDQEEEETIPSGPAMDRVIRDNMKYIRERQSGGVRFQNSYVGNRKDDKEGGDDGGSGSGCNDNFGQFGGGRCVF